MQAYGLVILTHLDEITAARGETDAVKLAMLASAEFDHRKLFPEYFPEKQTVVDADSAEAADPAAQYDYSEVSWKSPSESMDEYHRLMAALQNSSSGVVKGDQLPANSWGEWH